MDSGSIVKGIVAESLVHVDFAENRAVDFVKHRTAPAGAVPEMEEAACWGRTWQDRKGWGWGKHSEGTVFADLAAGAHRGSEAAYLAGKACPEEVDSFVAEVVQLEARSRLLGVHSHCPCTGHTCPAVAYARRIRDAAGSVVAAVLVAADLAIDNFAPGKEFRYSCTSLMEPFVCRNRIRRHRDVQE